MVTYLYFLFTTWQFTVGAEWKTGGISGSGEAFGEGVTNTYHGPLAVSANETASEHQDKRAHGSQLEEPTEIVLKIYSYYFR